MDYRNLSIAEKIERVQEYRAYGAEKKHQAAYLNALQASDTQQIAEYEAFGDTPRQIIMNLNSYQQAQTFEFTGREFNEYGWLANAHFTNVEHIEFFHKKGWAAHNYITIGRGANGKWSYGASYSTGGAGGGYGLGIWGKMFDNRKECLAAALRELSDRHEQERKRHPKDDCNFNSTLSNTIVKQVTVMLSELTVAKQLTLLFN